MQDRPVTIESPAWLADEPEITTMLHAVIDRFDAQGGADRQRDIHISAQASLPSLEASDAQADQTWLSVKSLAELGVLKVKLAKRSPYDPEWVNAKLAFPPTSEVLLRAWLDRAPTTRAIHEWREAVRHHAHIFGGAIESLAARRIDITGRKAGEIVAALASIDAIAGPITLRQLSARIFWGDSKVLDQRAELIGALFPRLQIRERPIVVSAYLPTEFTGVLFIENQDTYAATIRSSNPCAQGLAFVYASGFRSSATRIRSRDGAILHFSGPAGASAGASFERWWFNESPGHLQTWFWGDLDFAGMQILKTLRARFGGTRAWNPGYEPMLPLALSSTLRAGDRKEQVDPIATGDEYADNVLLPAMRSHGFVDQESTAFL